MRVQFYAQRTFAALFTFTLLCGIATRAAATDDSKKAPGSNHQAAHALATGNGVNIAILDLIRTNTAGQVFMGLDTGMVSVPDPAQNSPAQTMVVANNLGLRIQQQNNFAGQPPRKIGGPADLDMQAQPDPHATLGADVAAGGLFTYGNLDTNPKRDFLGVAKDAGVYYGAVDQGATYTMLNSLQFATDYLRSAKQVKIFNMSFGFADSMNDTASMPGPLNDDAAMYADWFINSKGPDNRDRDALIIKSAGNRGAVGGNDDELPMTPGGQMPPNLNMATNKITKLGDFYNGITVGASSDNFQARAPFSSWQLGGNPELRGKPEILAPGSKIWDGKQYAGPDGPSGTSFAAPHVAGTAALIAQRLGNDDNSHRIIKALILNGARKPNIVGVNTVNGISNDLMTDGAYDEMYIDANKHFRARTNNPNDLTLAWTPTNWEYKPVDPLNPNGRKYFTTDHPLDEEQGTGMLDSERALRNHLGGEHNPGGTNNVAVPLIGWSRSSFAAPPNANGLPAVTAKTYTFNAPLLQDTFLTATLVWDRIIKETNGDTDPRPENVPASAVDQVDYDDKYEFLGMANLGLKLFEEDSTNPGQYTLRYAESVSPADNLQHLHIPIMETAKYQLMVEFFGVTRPGNDNTVIGATPYALAWISVPEPAGILFLPLVALSLRRRPRRDSLNACGARTATPSRAVPACRPAQEAAW